MAARAGGVRADAVALNPAMVIGPHDPTGTASNRRVLGLAKFARFAPAFDGGLGVVDVADVGAAAGGERGADMITIFV